MKRLLATAALFCGLLTYPLFAVGQELTIQAGTGKPVVLNRTDLESLPHSKVTTGNSVKLRSLKESP